MLIHFISWVFWATGAATWACFIGLALAVTIGNIVCFGVKWSERANK